jgi:hypothetical protein
VLQILFWQFLAYSSSAVLLSGFLNALEDAIVMKIEAGQIYHGGKYTILVIQIGKNGLYGLVIDSPLAEQVGHTAFEIGNDGIPNYNFIGHIFELDIESYILEKNVRY